MQNGEYRKKYQQYDMQLQQKFKARKTGAIVNVLKNDDKDQNMEDCKRFTM